MGEQRQVPLRHSKCGQPLVCPHCGQTIIVEYSTADFPDGAYAPTVELPGSTSERNQRCPGCGGSWHHICDFSRNNPDRFLP